MQAPEVKPVTGVIEPARSVGKRPGTGSNGIRLRGFHRQPRGWTPAFPKLAGGTHHGIPPAVFQACGRRSLADRQSIARPIRDLSKSRPVRILGKYAAVLG